MARNKEHNNCITNLCKYKSEKDATGKTKKKLNFEYFWFQIEQSRINDGFFIIKYEMVYERHHVIQLRIVFDVEHMVDYEE